MLQYDKKNYELHYSHESVQFIDKLFQVPNNLYNISNIKKIPNTKNFQNRVEFSKPSIGAVNFSLPSS